MFKYLLQKIREFAKSKPDPDYLPSDPPDPDKDTAREIPSPGEQRTKWINIFKIKF